MDVLGHFIPIFGQKIDPKLPRSHFFLKEYSKKKNFSSKFQFSAKVMMVSPGGQTVTKTFWLVVNSEMLKGIKNIFWLCEQFFRVPYIFKPTSPIVSELKTPHFYLLRYDCNCVCCKMMDVFYDRIITAMKNAKSIFLKPPFLLVLQNVNDIHCA